MSNDKRDWLIGLMISPRIAWTPIAFPFCVGYVEITRTGEREATIIAALQASAADAGIALSEPPLLARVTILDVTLDAAWSWARAAVWEVLDALRLEKPFGLDADVLPVGFAFDINTATCRPLLKRMASRSPWGMMIARDDFAVQPLFLIRATAMEKLEKRTQLQAALFRSLHWSRLASRAVSPIDRFLFQWMALEAVCKLNQDDDIVGHIPAALGLIKESRGFDPDERLELATPELKALRKTVLTLADDCRRLRNNVVHSGFRDFEVLNDSLLTPSHERMLRAAVPAAHWIACHGITLGMTTLAEPWTEGFVKVIRKAYRRPFDTTIRDSVVERLRSSAMYERWEP